VRAAAAAAAAMPRQDMVKLNEELRSELQRAANAAVCLAATRRGRGVHRAASYASHAAARGALQAAVLGSKGLRL
jgi:hypothetical protein